MDTATIKERAHELYWNENVNCTDAMLICLSELFDVELDPHVLLSTTVMFGTACFGLQCGLVEGASMFIGIYYNQLGKKESAIQSSCCTFLETFNQ